MRVSGIYCIKNLVNGKKYIGSALNCKHRFNRHKSDLRKNRHQNVHLQAAWNKYGEFSFEFRIILICERFELDRYEIGLIRAYNVANRDFGYNLDLGGVANGREVSDETRRKISLTKRIKGDWKGNKNPGYGKPFIGDKHPMQGKHLSESATDRISKALINFYKDKTKCPMYGKMHTEETKQKIGESRKGKYGGKNSPMYGRRHSSESIQKMSKSHKGKTLSEDTKLKMSEVRKGRKFTEEHKKHLRESLQKSCLRGKDNPRYGKLLSEEIKRKMSVGRKLAWQRKKEGEN